MICKLKLHSKGFYWKHLRALHALEDLEPLFKFPIHLSVGKSREIYRQTYGKSKASLWRNLSTGTPPKFFRTFLCFVALLYNWYFFSEQPFYGNHSTLDSHTNTVISHTFAYSSRWRRKPWQGLLIFTLVLIRNTFYSLVKTYRRKSQTTRKRWEFSLEQGTFLTNIQLYQNYIMQTCQYL